MRYRMLSEDDDYTFGGSELNFYRDVPEAVGQAAKTRLLLWLGEWFLDTAEGTPYMQGVLGKHSQALADATVRDRIFGTEGLTTITDFESLLDREARALSITATIDTIYGPTQLEIANYANY